MSRTSPRWNRALRWAWLLVVSMSACGGTKFLAPASGIETFFLDSDEHGFYSSNAVDRSPGHPRKPRHKRPGDRDWSKCPPERYLQEPHCRAGNPLNMSRWARCSVSSKYAGAHVGGGAAIGGRGRHLEEGTWGIDYRGLLPPRAVVSCWTCGREQSGAGAYQTDGMVKSATVSAKVRHVLEGE